MRSFVAAVAILLTLCARAGAQVPPTPVQKALELDNLVAGKWRSDVGPDEFVKITPWGSGMMAISDVGRFSAAGFFDGREIIAIMREDSGRTGILRARLRNPGEIEAAFSADLAATPHRREIWRSVFPKPSKPPVDPPPAPDTGDPKLGEYVYVEELPEAIHKANPEYRGVDGTVLVQALVGSDGSVTDTKVVKSVAGLDEAAVAAVMQWRFKPAMAKGKPVAVWVAIPIRFQAR